MANIDSDETKEIIDNKGWILVLKFQDNQLEVVQSIPVDANCSFQSLRVGDVVKGDAPEIITPVYRKTGDAWNTYVVGWNTDGELIFNKPVYTRGDYQYQIIHLDVGNVIPEFGEEIVVANQAPDELILYYWDGERLVESTHFPLDPYVALTKVYISNSGCESGYSTEIIACGGCFHPDSAGDFYLETICFDEDEFFSKWDRMGGKKGELRVSYGGFGKANN